MTQRRRDAEENAAYIEMSEISAETGAVEEAERSEHGCGPMGHAGGTCVEGRLDRKVSVCGTRWIGNSNILGSPFSGVNKIAGSEWITGDLAREG